VVWVAASAAAAAAAAASCSLRRWARRAANWRRARVGFRLSGAGMEMGSDGERFAAAAPVGSLADMLAMF